MNHHNHNGKKNSSMMWMMLICLLPLAVLFFVGSGRFSTGYIVPILIGVCVGAHIWMMRRGHGEHSDTNEEKKFNLSADVSAKDSVSVEAPPSLRAELEQAGAPLEKPDTKDEHKKDKQGGCCH